MTEFPRALVLMIGVAAMSFILVGALRRYAIARGILDHPKERSSHSVATPRGGGAGVIIAAFIGYVFLAPAGALDWRIVLALLGVIPTAIAGWLDDHGHVPPLQRLGAHIASAVLLVPLAIEARTGAPFTLLIAAGWIAATVAAVNVVNFIDGIDGLVGGQALVFGVHVWLLGEAGSPGDVLGLALAAASAGFLIWNWAPARIFLGDVGSGSLAVIGVIAGMLVWRADSWPFVAIFLPLFPIFLDAAATIIQRARRGERLTSPHRSHLYQRLARDNRWGHARVSLLYAALAGSATFTVLVIPMRWLFWACAGYGVFVAVLAWLLGHTLHQSSA